MRGLQTLPTSTASNTDLFTTTSLCPVGGRYGLFGEGHSGVASSLPSHCQAQSKHSSQPQQLW